MGCRFGDGRWCQSLGRKDLRPSNINRFGIGWWGRHWRLKARFVLTTFSFHGIGLRGVRGDCRDCRRGSICLCLLACGSIQHCLLVPYLLGIRVYFVLPLLVLVLVLVVLVVVVLVLVLVVFITFCSGCCIHRVVILRRWHRR